MKAALITTIAALAVLVPVASLAVYAQSGSAALGGIVIDPTGAVIANVRVTVSDQDGHWGPASRLNWVPPAREFARTRICNSAMSASR